MTSLVKDLKTDKVQYAPGDEVVITFGFDQLAADCRVRLQIADLAEILHEVEWMPGETVSDVTEFRWVIPECFRFSGFGIDLLLLQANAVVEVASTSFDVVTHWSQAPRYGFLATFHPEKSKEEMDAKLSVMAEFRLTIVQFYDWMYRHHQLLPDVNPFFDIFNRPLCLETVSEQIALCKQHGMKPLAYGAMYGAEKDFVVEHPDWVAAPRNMQGRNSMLDEHPEYIQVMNIASDCGWRSHIVNEYRKAITTMGFAGIHVDQYGFPKTYFSIVGEEPVFKDMGVEFGNFLEYSREALGDQVALIFNAVNNWPIEIVATKPQDAIYIEVWSPYDTFTHLRSLIWRAKELSGFTKQVILAAYIGSLSREKEIPHCHGQRSARITSAAIFANGGFHLVMGEGTSMLTGAYYPEYRELSPAFSRVMRDYYQTITRYSKYLYSPDLRDRSEVLTGGINGEICITHEGKMVPIGPDATVDTIWTIVQENQAFKVLHLVNLLEVDTTRWNEPQSTDPVICHDLVVDWLVDEDITGVYFVNPDGGDLRAKRLEHKRLAHQRGETLRFVVPKLEYWSFVVLKTK